MVFLSHNKILIFSSMMNGSFSCVQLENVHKHHVLGTNLYHKEKNLLSCFLESRMQIVFCRSVTLSVHFPWFSAD